MTMAIGDNLDLQIRRARLRPRWTQRDVQKAIQALTGQHVAVSAISDFENGHRDDLPNNLGRKEYEIVLEQAERASVKGRAK